VERVKIIHTKKQKEENKKPRTFIIDFKGTSVPSHIFWGYRRVSVKPYVPLPTQCFGCGLFGYVAKKCPRCEGRDDKKLCGNCGDLEHRAIMNGKRGRCDKSPHCANCNVSGHNTFDKRCPKFIVEKLCNEAIVKFKCTRQEAKGLIVTNGEGLTLKTFSQIVGSNVTEKHSAQSRLSRFRKFNRTETALRNGSESPPMHIESDEEPWVNNKRPKNSFPVERLCDRPEFVSCGGAAGRGGEAPIGVSPCSFDYLSE
jgi:hypothetical protein